MTCLLLLSLGPFLASIPTHTPSFNKELLTSPQGHNAYTPS